MKKNVFDWIISLGFCLFLGGMLLLFLLLPEKGFSTNEKRYLAERPRLTVNSLLSGDFARQAESYAADHLPGRDFFVGLNARYDLLSGRQVTKEIYRGKSGRLYEAPVSLDDKEIERRMGVIRDFAEAVGRPVHFVLIPSAGFVLREDMPALSDPYPDDAVIASAYALAGERLRPIDLLSVFEAAPDRGSLYYRTDHHWTAAGACLACREILSAVGRAALAEERYQIRTVEGFYGTTYARSALWDTSGETLELWESGTAFSVENMDSPGVHEGLYYEERLTEADKYPVYLDGNHSLVRIRNLSGNGHGKLLLIRDSFSNCLGCFLAESYEEIVLADLRYWRTPVSELLTQEEFDDVMIVYSVSNFLTDSSLLGLE